jgi:hypothetical protein
VSWQSTELEVTVSNHNLTRKGKRVIERLRTPIRWDAQIITCYHLHDDNMIIQCMMNKVLNNENNAAIEADIVLETDDEYCQWEVRTSCHWQHFFNKYQRRRRRIIKTNYYGK